MRFTILSFVLFGALFAAEAPSPSTNAEQKEQPIKAGNY